MTRTQFPTVLQGEIAAHVRAPPNRYRRTSACARSGRAQDVPLEDPLERIASKRQRVLEGQYDHQEGHAEGFWGITMRGDLRDFGDDKSSGQRLQARPS